MLGYFFIFYIFKLILNLLFIQLFYNVKLFLFYISFSFSLFYCSLVGPEIGHFKSNGSFLPQKNVSDVSIEGLHCDCGWALIVELCGWGWIELEGRKLHVDSVPPCPSRAAIMWRLHHAGSNEYGQYWHGYCLMSD